MCDRSDGVRREEFGPNVGDEDDRFLEAIVGIVEEVLPDGTAKIRVKGSVLVYPEDTDAEEGGR